MPFSVRSGQSGALCMGAPRAGYQCGAVTTSGYLRSSMRFASMLSVAAKIRRCPSRARSSSNSRKIARASVRKSVIRTCTPTVGAWRYCFLILSTRSMMSGARRSSAVKSDLKIARLLIRLSSACSPVKCGRSLSMSA